MIKLHSDEKIVTTMRRHWFVLLTKGVGFTFGALLPLVFFVGAFVFFSGWEVSMRILVLFSFFYSLWVLIFWIGFFVIWTDYYLDVWYITNKRIIDVEQKGFFFREISSLYYEKIQDITTSVSGVIATFLDFGRIHVRTASGAQDIVLDTTAHPDEMKRVISAFTEKESENVQRVRMVSESEDEDGPDKQDQSSNDGDGR